MSNEVPFPQPESSRGYCARCGHEINVPHNAAWPETCPGCHIAKPALASWRGNWTVGRFTVTSSSGVT